MDILRFNPMKDLIRSSTTVSKVQLASHLITSTQKTEVLDQGRGYKSALALVVDDLKNDS